MSSELIERVLDMAAEAQKEKWNGCLRIKAEWSWDGITFRAKIVPQNARHTYIVIDFFTGQARIWIDGDEVGAPELN